MSKPPSLQEIQDLAANYSDRQGLRVIPMALAVIAQGFRLPSTFLGIDTMLIALVIGIAGYFLVGRYYEWRFGRVEELPYEGMSFFVQILLMVLAFPLAVTLDITGKSPIFASGFLIAVSLFATAWPSRRIRGEYLSLACVLALFSFAPLIGLTITQTAQTCGFWFGAMLLIAGIRDHISFVRVFARAEAA